MIKDELVEWIKEQPYWSQVIANSILRGEKLNEDSLNKIYILFKQESGLLKKPLEKEELEFLTINDSTDNSIKMRWGSVSKITGVNALKEGEALNIGKQMTVVYGENGTGKSGYTRLLNNAFVSRGDKNILANIFEENKMEPSAVFSFQDDEDRNENKLFPEDRNHHLFSSVSVFDTVSAVNDLTQESELAFVPMEFKFFEEFTYAIVVIKSKLVEEIEANQRINEFGDFFDKNTSIKKIVQKINGQTKYSEIKSIANTSELEELYKERIKKKTNLQSLNINEKLKEYNKLKQDITKIKDKISLFNNKFTEERIVKTEELLIERAALKELSSKEGLSQLEGEDIYRLGSTEWKEFILAAKKYNNSINEEIANCLFCGQNIEEVTVIDKYWKYLKSSAEKNLVVAESKIKQIKADFTSQNLNIIIEGSQIEDWLEESMPNLYEQLIIAEKKFTSINLDIIENLSKLEWIKNTKSYSLDISIFDEVFEVLERNVKQLDADKVNKELNDINIFLDEYTDKLKLEKLLPRVEIYINTMKWVDLARQINLSTAKITTFQNKLFSKYISSKYIQKFRIECEKLDADFSAEIQQRGRKGATLSRLEIKGRKPIEILSEGEQRSIALANFLAETSLNDSNVCLVFDDPVCSLDHKRRETIAKRLVEEAHEKQIVIFTHDIIFLMEIQNHCKSNAVDCCVTTIRKFQNDAGIVQEDRIPWEGMAVSKRIKFLRHELQTINTFHNSIDSDSIGKLDEYKGKTKSWCSLLRETWERTVEEILFNNAVQRFSPAIQTQRLKNALFTKELFEEIEIGMSNCSNWVHDRAGSLGEKVPTPDELKEYLKSCDDFIKANDPNNKKVKG